MFYNYLKKNRRRKKGETFEQIDFTYFDEKSIKALSTSILFYLIILISISLILLNKINHFPPLTDSVIIIKYVIIFYTSFFFLKFILDLRKAKQFFEQLEDFEKEIFFENISNEKIAEMFEEQFYGIPFNKWLEKQKLEISNLYEKIEKEYKTFDTSIIKLDTLYNDKEYIECNELLQQLLSNHNSMYEEVKAFIQRKNNNFKQIIRFASLNKIEIEDLIQTQKFFKMKTSKYESTYLNFGAKLISRAKYEIHPKPMI